MCWLKKNPTPSSKSTWTEKEVDDIMRKARRDSAEFQRYAD
jgi:hypothetical protein